MPKGMGIRLITNTNMGQIQCHCCDYISSGSSRANEMRMRFHYKKVHGKPMPKVGDSKPIVYHHDSFKARIVKRV